MLETLKGLPESPGVYQYFDANGRLLYVGKAKNLKHRVKSYWRFTPELRPNPNQSARILKMLHEAERLDYLVVDSEEDALILENSLIKQLKPRYNILLRDDKTYPYIYIDRAEPFPRFDITRKIVKGKKIAYYGPFPGGARVLLDALYELFPLVQSKSCLRGTKACLFHQIGKCLAPCEGKVTPETYAEIVDKATDALLNRAVLTEALEAKMLAYAEQERFEEAAKLRDAVTTIRDISLHSALDTASHIDADIFAIVNGEDRGVIVRMFMREGKVVSSSHSFFRDTRNFDPAEAYTQALLSFYGVDTPYVPKEVLVADDFEGRDSLAATLGKRLGKRVTLAAPKRGTKKRLTELARKNAEELLRRAPARDEIENDVAALLGLSRTPWRVEAFDNSHMMGAATVGAMVVWNDGAWDKESYRRYELNARDEVGQMRELLSRRIARFEEMPPPDVWVIDGGKVNLDIAVELLAKAGVNIDVVAIAKEKLDAKAHRAKGAARDILHTVDNTFILKPTDKRLQWIQRLRDEAHRFAVTYHRTLKRKEDMKLHLLEEKGIGKATLKKLLNHFGTFDAICRATPEELQEILPFYIADRIYSDCRKKT